MYACRSTLYVDGIKVVDNDGNAQSQVKKCASTTLTSGFHTMYLEGWTQSATLSMSASFRGPDTSGEEMEIHADSSPFAPSSSPASFHECPSDGDSGDSNFTVCAFKASNQVDLGRVDDIASKYMQATLQTSSFATCNFC